MSPACVVTGLVHNEFMTLNAVPHIFIFKPPGLPGGFLFSGVRIFNPLKAFVHAIATRSHSPRQPLDPHSL
jgi:hypothetical protein